MRKLWIGFTVLAFVLCTSRTSNSEEPIKITVCQLKTDPSVYNHKLIEVEGFVSHDFEDFSLSDPLCKSEQGVWLEYGGKSKSDTTYCCGPTNGKKRAHELKVENIPIPLVEDDQFRLFDKQIQPPFRTGQHGAIARATIIGRFYSGEKVTYPDGTSGWAGYGHMGCCSLLAIQEIKSVGPQDQGDLDYGSSMASFDEINDQDVKVGCGVGQRASEETADRPLQEQKSAEQGDRSWAFDNPLRVASEGLIRLARLNVSGTIALQETHKAPGRVVYEWRASRDGNIYTVVVSRPFWLSFYSHDPKRVAWVVSAVTEISCPR